MPIERVPLTVANFADGAMAREVNDAIALILERFRRAEDGEIDLSGDKATITLKMHIERDPGVGGFRCSFEEPNLKMPAKVSVGTVAIERDGVLVVDVEASGEQMRLLKPNNSDTN